MQLKRFWAHSLLRRMNFVQRRATTAKSKHSIDNFYALKESFLDDVCATMTWRRPTRTDPELGLDRDQTGLLFILSSP